MNTYPIHFLHACNAVLTEEGGYVHDPRDPGGETKFGISKRAYPDLVIADLTLGDAMEIYFRDYWLAASCQHFPGPIARVVFDAAVNQGVRTSIKMLQEALNVGSDGVVGKRTIEAASTESLQTVLVDFTVARILRYMQSPEFRVYARGWLRRALRLLLSARNAE